MVVVVGDVSTSRSLINVGDVINIIIGVLAIISLIISVIGIILVPLPAFLIWWTHERVKETNNLIDSGELGKARDRLILPSVLSMLVASFIGGLLILIGAVMLPGDEEKGVTGLMPPVE